MSLPHFSRKPSLIDNVLFRKRPYKCYEKPTNGLVAAVGSHNSVISTYGFFSSLRKERLVTRNVRRRSDCNEDSER